MATSNAPRRSRFSLLWIAELLTYWKEIASLVGSGVVTTFGIAELINPWGYFGWSLVFVGLGLAIWLLLSAGSALLAWAQSRRSLALFTDWQRQTGKINPLRVDFENEQIDLRDFYHPSPNFRKRENVSFRRCELFGPMNVALTGLVNFRGNNKFSDCEIIVIKKGMAVSSPIVLEHATFTDCRIHSVTFFLNATDARGINQQIFHGAFKSISDGTFGEDI
jgi:hypothetical protein